MCLRSVPIVKVPFITETSRRELKNRVPSLRLIVDASGCIERFRGAGRVPGGIALGCDLLFVSEAADERSSLIVELARVLSIRAASRPDVTRMTNKVGI